MTNSWDAPWSFGEPVEPGVQQPADAPTLNAGDTFAGGKYQIEALIGRGGMGAVYRAREVASQRLVALKLIRGRMSYTDRARFQREGELTASLDYPGIVRVHSLGEHAGCPYLVYELVEGCQTLAAAWDSLDRDGRLRHLVDVAKAVGHAHAVGVTHRDLKPENVLIDAAGRVRVVDFGVAVAGHVERLTKTGVMVGTPAFMAPEQIRGERSEQGPPVDVWALGVCIYCALTDEVPFSAESLAQLAYLVLNVDPPPPRRVDPSVPKRLELVCLKCLRRRPQDRYPDAGALAVALEAALAGDPPATSRRAAKVGWLAVVLGLSALAVTYAVSTPPKATSARPPPVAEPLPPAPRPSVDLAPPDLEPASLARGREHLQRGEFEAALAQADGVLALDPDLPAALALRGRSLARLNRLGEAIVSLTRAIELEPTAQRVFLRARTRHALGHVKHARLDYERALELQRSLMPAVQGRALTGVQLGAYASAREDFSRLLEANPADELARVGRAFCAVNEGDLDVALDDCDAALRRRPNAPRALGIRAFVRALRGDHRGAISDGDAALRGTARAPTARAARALAKALAGDTQGAVQDLQPLGANASFDTLALSCQAYVLVVAGRSAEGLSLSERALKLNSRFELAREACARAHLQLGDHEQAIRECTWVLADMSADYPTRRRVERLLEEARAR